MYYIYLEKPYEYLPESKKGRAKKDYDNKRTGSIYAFYIVTEVEYGY